MENMDKTKLEELIEELGNIKGRHTELVTVYIPSGFNISTVVRQLETEAGTAANIKSKNTRKSVLAALERIIRELKLYKQTPPNGMAVFCGNVSSVEGQEDIKLWAIEPPKPLNVRLYRCDQVFVLDPLREMLEVSEIYGLLVMDRKEATIGLLEGKQIKVLRKMSSAVPGKYKAGGQSAARFERIREGMAKEFYRKIADSVKEIFFNMPRLKGILIGGPIPTKEDFLKEGQLVTALKEKVIAVKDIGYADEHGLELLVEASQENLAEQEIIHEKQLLEKFFEMLGKHPEKVAYGKQAVEKAIEYGAVETLIISKKVDKKVAQELIKKAENISAKIEIVSTETPEGEQFYSLKGIGAILRFQVG
jgi:peptide chain release factor subunit 1